MTSSTHTDAGSEVAIADTVPANAQDLRQTADIVERLQKAARALEHAFLGKEEVIRAREEWEQDEKKRREESTRIERRLDEREANLDRKIAALDDREAETNRRDQSIAERSQALEAKEQEIHEAGDTHRRRLEELAGPAHHRCGKAGRLGPRRERALPRLR